MSELELQALVYKTSAKGSFVRVYSKGACTADREIGTIYIADDLAPALVARIEGREEKRLRGDMHRKLGNQIGPEIFKARHLLCSSCSGKGTGLVCSDCCDDSAQEALDMKLERDALQAENGRLQDQIPHPGDGSCDNCGRVPSVHIPTSLCPECLDLKAENERLKEALQTFGEHQRECDRFYWERGEPTADGGYRTMWKGKWYVRPDEPPCACGLNAALAPTEENQK